MSDAVSLPPIDWVLLGPFLWLTAGAVAVTLMAVGPRAWRHYTGYLALIALVPPAIAPLRLWSAHRGHRPRARQRVAVDWTPAPSPTR